MNTRVLCAFLLVGLAAFAMAQEDDTVVVRIYNTNSDNSDNSDSLPTLTSSDNNNNEPEITAAMPLIPSPFDVLQSIRNAFGPTTSMPPPPPMMMMEQPTHDRFSHRRPFGGLLQRLFNFDINDNNNNENNNNNNNDDDDQITIVRVIETDNTESPSAQSETTSSDDSSAPSEPLFGLSRALERFASMITSMPMAGVMEVQPESDGKSHRRGCPLMRACHDDVERLCATARLSAIAGSVGQCLKDHINELSEQCSAMVNKHSGVHASESSAESDADATADPAAAAASGASSEETSESTESTETAPATPSDVDAHMPCLSDVRQFCPDMPQGAEGRVHMIACLYRYKDRLSPACLDSVKERAAFKCALDAETQCAGITGRHNIMRCLIGKYQQGVDLSSDCVSVLDAVHAKPSTPAAASTTTSPATPTFVKPRIQELKTGAALLSAVPSATEVSKMNVIPLLIGGAALIVVIGVVTVVVARRRNRRRYEQMPVVNMAAINPSQMAVDITPAYEPRPEEQL